MKLAIVGTGYVGLVTGTCFAESGNEVTCLDINAERISELNNGRVPIYEPGLDELVASNVTAGRLRFQTEVPVAVADADIVFLAVGTPQSQDGSADLSAIHAVTDTLATHVTPRTLVVTKSTVPVGTNSGILRRLQELLGERVPLVASNPEFLREGSALHDFQHPDRVVVGVTHPESAARLRALYQPFLGEQTPFLVMGLESAEMTKYAANSFLAAKISFINEMARLCTAVGADIEDVRYGMGYDHRIGFSFLLPGAGYGGSCFPKDVRALQRVAEQHGMTPYLLPSIDAANEAQKQVLFQLIDDHYGGELAGRTVVVWGLAFKPGTDDIREASSLVLIRQLLEAGATVRAHDPVAMENVRRELGDQIVCGDDPLALLENADALAVVTEWDAYRNPDFAELRRRMHAAVLFDGRNLYSPQDAREAGFTYYGIGRT